MGRGRWALSVVVAIVATLTGCAIQDARPATPRTTFTPPKEHWVQFVGDSYTGGSEMGGRAEKGWPTIVGARLRTDGLAMTAVADTHEGSSGYARRGLQGGVFADQLKFKDLSLIVFFGSRNDGGIPLDELAMAVGDTYAKAKAASPKARLLVLGPLWPEVENLPPGGLAVRDTVRDQALAAGATFVDPLAEGWLDDPALMGPDGVHPNDAGHAYLAEKIEPLMQTALS